MIQKTNPSVISQNFPQASSPTILLRNSTFKMKFAVFSKNLQPFLIEPSLFKITLAAVKLNLSNSTPNNSRSWTYHDFSYHICSPEEINEEKYLVSTGFTHALCADYDDLEIGGGYFDTSFSKFSLKLYLCKNDSAKEQPCKSPEEIAQFFQDKYFSVYYRDVYVDVNDYGDPLKSFPNVETMELSAWTENTNHINFVAGNLIQDDGILLPSEKQFNYFSKDKQTSGSINRDYFNDTSPIGEFDFTVSPNLIQIKRIYQKMPDVLAKLSGIANFLILFVFLIMNIFQKMILELYFLQKVIKYDKKPKLYRNQRNAEKSPSNINIDDSILKKERNLNEKNHHLTNQKAVNDSISYSLENRKNIEFTYITPKKPEDDSFQSDRNIEIKNDITKQESRNFSMVASQIINPTSIIFSEMNDYVITKIKCFLGCKLNEKQKIYSQNLKNLEKLLNIKHVLRKIQALDTMEALLDDKNIKII